MQKDQFLLRTLGFLITSVATSAAKNRLDFTFVVVSLRGPDGWSIDSPDLHIRIGAHCRETAAGLLTPRR